MLGFMIVTAFISMWITNTATTAMMTPIMEAVLKQLDEELKIETQQTGKRRESADAISGVSEITSPDALEVRNYEVEITDTELMEITSATVPSDTVADSRWVYCRHFSWSILIFIRSSLVILLRFYEDHGRRNWGAGT